MQPVLTQAARDRLKANVAWARGARIDLQSGKRVNPLRLRPVDICIEDIAHSLALINRFGGHSRYPINVAQHSVHCSRLCDGTPHALQALLHDAAEYVLGDIVKWLKATDVFIAYRRVERRIQRRIYERFDCHPVTAPDVEMADRLMVRFEGTKAYGDAWVVGHPAYPSLTEEELRLVGPWEPWGWEMAERMFLARFNELTA